MSTWNLSNVWRAIGRAQPDAPAIVQGDRVVTWRSFIDRSESGATWLREHSIPEGAKIALYMYNCAEYLEGFTAALTARCVPVNTNYRYGVDELVYLFTNADAEVVIFHGIFTEKIAEVRAQVPTLRYCLFVDDGTTTCPEWATPYEEFISSPIGELPEGSPDDLVFLYTGGTTGMPKGVMWRNDDLFQRLNASSFRRFPETATAADVADVIKAEGPSYATLAAPPLMHGTGLFSAIGSLSTGGRVILLPSRSFDPVEMAEQIDAQQVAVAVIVGDPFARPLLRVLDANPGRYSLTSLFAMLSSGAMWSAEIKSGLLAHHDMMLIDAFSSSEAVGLGASVSSGSSAKKTAEFSLGDDVRVIGDDGKDVVPGSDQVGRLILGGRIPLGYYKDQKKTDATFQVHDGVRYSVPGDMAMVNADGSIHLLGRGSQCINTAGEKVFPEEVEEALKTHEAVADACVVGTPHETYGEQITAAVEFHPGAAASESDLIAYVKTRLASYKAPRHIRVVDTVGRAVNGKMDYARHLREAKDWLATLN
jgi:fatty-acyl-CoA synthase